jgi:hypothetical protein
MNIHFVHPAQFLDAIKRGREIIERPIKIRQVNEARSIVRLPQTNEGL